MSMQELWVETAKGEHRATYSNDGDGYQKAREHAERIKGYVIEATYEFDDSTVLDDFRDDQTEDRTRKELMSEQQLLEHAATMILGYFVDEMDDVLTMDWEQAHAEVAKWMSTERPDNRILATWEFRNAYESVVKAQREFRS